MFIRLKDTPFTSIKLDGIDVEENSKFNKVVGNNHRPGLVNIPKSETLYHIGYIRRSLSYDMEHITWTYDMAEGND